MKKQYDFVFITNIPSFYKINLYNLISDKFSVKVIFLADKSDIRKDDFYKGDMRFEYVFINKGAFEQRSRLSGLLKIIKILSSIKYKKLVFPGWEIKELCLLSLLTTKRKNCVAVESSILETERSLLKWMLKKLFLKRMATGLPSGHLQAEIFHEMNFSGELVYTNGVGVLNEKFYCQSGQSIHCLIGSKNIKYIYVGRIADEKNLELLCKVMTETDKYLTIVGYGPKETELIEKYGHAVNFLGSIDNESLKEIYSQHHVFILPSKSEPWGLVVEEALCSGLPVIVSDMVGSKRELVENKSTGVTFEYANEASLISAIEEIEKNYSFYKENVESLDLTNLVNEKIEPYSRLMKL